MHHRARVLTFATILALFGVLVATFASAQDDQPTRLLLWDNDWGPDSAAIDALIDRFNEMHPDIEVVREVQPNTAVRDILRTSLGAGEGPDIVNYDTGPGFAGELARAGLLHPLDEAYETYGWDDRFLSIARDRTTFDGVTYGIGHELEVIGVFYNQRIFEELGLEEPGTHEEFMQLCETLQSEGYFPVAFGNQPKWPATHYFSTFAGNIAGPDMVAAAVSGEADWNAPEFVSALEVPFVEMREAGCYNPDINAISYDDMNLLFYSGQAAMSLTGTWMVGDYSDPDIMPDPVGFFFYPSIDGEAIAPPTGLGSGYFVSSASEDPEAAFEFLDFMFSDEAAEVWVETLRRIPAIANLDGDAYDIPDLLNFTIDRLQENPESLGYNIDVLVPGTVVTEMFDGFQQVIGGQRPPEQQADILQQTMQEAMEAGEVIDITSD